MPATFPQNLPSKKKPGAGNVGPVVAAVPFGRRWNPPPPPPPHYSNKKRK
jgi:hypothetical protein